jgi:PAS domain S-box-containing protein
MMIVLLTTGIALLAAGIGMLTRDLSVYRKSWASDLATEAQILALSTAPALAFDDHEAAIRNLAALQARPQVLAAALYASNGTLYAQFLRLGEAAPPLQLDSSVQTIRVTGELIELSQPIVQKGERLGSIFLRARYDVVGRIKAYLGIFALVMLMSLAVALALSTALQKVITRPLEAMASVAQEIVSQRDYSLRAQGRSDDEIGVVVRAFNAMLDEVQSRTRALEESNAALKEEVEVRQAAEAGLRRSEKLYRAIGESIDYGVWVSAADGRNVYASDSFLRLTGMSQAQCAESGWAEALHPDDIRATLAAWQECVRSGSFWYREHRVRGVDGCYHPILSQGVPIRDDLGQITGWAGINLDIARMKQTEDALREADRRKDEFLATLAHELRNPLAPIRHAVKLLEIPTADERQRQWGREVIARQVQRMALLLDDLLDVSRITRGRLELKKDCINLATLVASAVETARPLIETKQHELIVHLPPDSLELEVDPLRISQALSNLLTNAAKYTDAHGKIELRVSLEESELVASVEDNGIGLDPAALPKLFEMFSQVEAAVDRAEGGLGIGLALVKGLVGLHGGSVSATSVGLGRGSEFTIRLPRSVIVPHRPSIAERGAAAHMELGPRCKVLLADDNHDAADSLGLVLRLRSHEVWVTHSALGALELGARELPQVIILDIGMPDLSGYEAARRIRQQAWGRHALLIAVTGWGQEEDIERARAAGFDRHFTKPVDPEAIQALLVSYLAGPSTHGDGAPEIGRHLKG